MRSRRRGRKYFSILIIIVLAGLILSVAQLALAKMSASPPLREGTMNSPTGWGDDGVYEVGVEWMNVFPNPADNRRYWDVSCDGVYNKLIGVGWTPRFRFTNYSAQEKDGKRAALGGRENSYVDNVDLAMFCTHGGLHWDDTFHGALTSVAFGSSMDDQDLSPGDAYISYGDKDLEYLAFDSCSVLADHSFIYWASTFDGLHLLLGFLNSMAVNPLGDGWMWGYFMTTAYAQTVTQAWFSAIDYNQASNTCARIIGESQGNYNEHWWNTSPDPLVDSEKWVWDHCSHGYIYKLDNHQPAITSLPMVQVIDREVTNDYILNNIAPAFNMTGTIGWDDLFYSLATTTGGITETLWVDPVTGSYRYQNLSKLWTTPVVTPTLPSELEADNIINTWFNSTPAEGLPAMQYRNAGYIYQLEGMFNIFLSNHADGGLHSQTTKNSPTNVQMTYPRAIQVEVGTLTAHQMMDMPMFGAGARLVVYLGDQGEIIGVQGGSRDVQVMSQQVTILDPSKVWESYLADPSLAIHEVPILADYITYTNYVLGYYEMPYLQPQDELIPVYDFSADFYSGTELIAEGVDVFLPAAVEYLPPQVAILSPEDGATFWAGEPISFEGWINQGTPPYTIQWTSSSDGFLGDTLNLVSGIGSSVRSSTVFTPTVTLQVTDANGLTNTATISLAIKPIIWLPLITK